jgi:hypothetical protein
MGSGDVDCRCMKVKGRLHSLASLLPEISLPYQSEGILDLSSVGTDEVAKEKFVTPERNRKPIIRPVGWSLYSWS